MADGFDLYLSALERRSGRLVAMAIPFGESGAGGGFVEHSGPVACALAGWLFFVGTLFPALGFFNIYPFLYSFVADHFQYLASLGIIVLFASAVFLTIERISQPQQWIGYSLCAAVLLTLGTLTWRQCGMYSDIVTLYETTIERNPECFMAYDNMGALLNDADRSAGGSHVLDSGRTAAA